MRYVGVPGIDNLNQIGPGIVADFPKLAASAAHLYGVPGWEEAGGVGRTVNSSSITTGPRRHHMNIRASNAALPPRRAQGRANPAAAIGWYVTRSST